MDELWIELSTKLGISKNLINKAIKENDWNIVWKSQEMGYIMYNNNKYLILGIMKQYDDRFKQLEKFKTDVDRKIEAEKKRKEEEEITKKKELKDAEKAAEEAKKQEKLIQEKRERDLKVKEEAYNKSDYVSIINGIKNQFDKWLSKGEFEKTENYLERLKNKEFIFDSICHDIIVYEIHTKSGNIIADIKLGTYDADSEKFPIQISIKDNVFLDTLNIKLNEAESFKEKASYHHNINFPKDEANWCIIENQLFPLKLKLENTNFEFKIPIKNNFKLLNFSSNELKLENKTDELNYFFAEYESKNEKRKNELKLNRYNELLSQANYFESNKQLPECIEKLKIAFSIINSEDLKNRIELTQNKIDFEIKEKKYNEVLNEANENEKYQNYQECLKFLTLANSIISNQELIDRIISTQNKIESIRKKHTEIQKCIIFISENYTTQDYESKSITQILLNDNKKTSLNFQNSIQYLSAKFIKNDILIKNYSIANKSKLLWNEEDEKMLSIYNEKVDVLKTWINFNNSVLNLIKENEVRIIKKTDNPEELILKLTQSN